MYRSQVLTRLVALLIGMPSVSVSVARDGMGSAIGSNSCTLDFIRLKDQFGQVHVYEFPANQPMVLLVADKNANDALEPWIANLRDPLRGRATLVGIADVRGVPGLFQGKVKRKFQNARKHPVLMDWKGEILNLIQPEKEVPNIYLISNAGDVLFHVAGEEDADRLSELLQSFESLVARRGVRPISAETQQNSAVPGVAPPLKTR